MAESKGRRERKKIMVFNITSWQGKHHALPYEEWPPERIPVTLKKFIFEDRRSLYTKLTLNSSPYTLAHALHAPNIFCSFCLVSP
jgi:hypothetical protein